MLAFLQLINKVTKKTLIIRTTPSYLILEGRGEGGRGDCLFFLLTPCICIDILQWMEGTFCGFDPGIAPIALQEVYRLEDFKGFNLLHFPLDDYFE